MAVAVLAFGLVAGCATGGRGARIREIQEYDAGECRFLGTVESTERSGWDMSDDQLGAMALIRKRASAMGGNAYTEAVQKELGLPFDGAEVAQLAGVPPEVVRAHFADLLSQADTRGPLLTGGISVGRMVPMRLLPFRVICLLGMNDGDFPRRDPAAGAQGAQRGPIGSAGDKAVGVHGFDGVDHRKHRNHGTVACPQFADDSPDEFGRRQSAGGVVHQEISGIRRVGESGAHRIGALGAADHDPLGGRLDQELHHRDRRERRVAVGRQVGCGGEQQPGVGMLRIRRERGTAVAGLTSATRETLDELSVSDVFAQRLSSESLEPEVQARLVGLYQHVVSELAEAPT